MNRWLPYVIVAALAFSVWVSLSPYMGKRTSRLVLVTSPACVPCEALKRDWPEWALRYEETQDAERYGVTGTPTLIGFDRAGNETSRYQGYNGKEHLEQWIRNLP